MISSGSNAKIKTVSRLMRDRRFRHRQRQFVVEGVRWLSDALASHLQPVLVLYTIQHEDEGVVAEFSGPKALISDELMHELSDVEAPQGVFTILPLPDLAWPATPSLVLILDSIQDPGNMGSLLRTAAAAGVDGVVLTSGCVDVLNPKVLRAGMGAQLKLPLQKLTWDNVRGLAEKLTVFTATGSAETDYTSLDWTQPSALIVGNEGNGVGADALAIGQPITIPMAAQTESLNVAMAAGVILFEAARQRR